MISSELIKTTRILCLSETSDNLLMWSHYADSHKGFVVEFNTEHSFFNQKRSNKDEFGHLRKVNYVSEIPKLDPLCDEKIDYFLTKSSEWEYEKEWRMLHLQAHSSLTINSENSKYNLYKFPSAAVKSIILGCKISPEFEKEIVKLLKTSERYQHVAIYKAKRHEGSFKLLITPAD